MGAAQHLSAQQPALHNRCCTRSSTPGWWVAGTAGGSKHHADNHPTPDTIGQAKNARTQVLAASRLIRYATHFVYQVQFDLSSREETQHAKEGHANDKGACTLFLAQHSTPEASPGMLMPSTGQEIFEFVLGHNSLCEGEVVA